MPLPISAFPPTTSAAASSPLSAKARSTNNPLKTFGGYGVAEVPELQKLLHFICENGFEHHVSMNLSQTASAVHEALEKYLAGPPTTTGPRKAGRGARVGSGRLASGDDTSSAGPSPLPIGVRRNKHRS